MDSQRKRVRLAVSLRLREISYDEIYSILLNSAYIGTCQRNAIYVLAWYVHGGTMSWRRGNNLRF